MPPGTLSHRTPAPQRAGPERMPILRADLVAAIRAVDPAAAVPPADGVDQAAEVDPEQSADRVARRRGPPGAGPRTTFPF